MEPFHRYYVQNIMPHVHNIILAVIGIGILILAINYVALVNANLGVLGLENFWKRIVLVILIVVFTSYNAITYSAYATGDVKAAHTVPRTGKLLSLFLLDIAQVTFSASMFGVLYISGASEMLSDPACQQLQRPGLCLALPTQSVTLIFAFGALWHATVMAWYAVGDGLGERNVRTHFGFAAVYLVLVLANVNIPWFRGWTAIAAFALVILWVYQIQARYWLGGGTGSNGSEKGNP